MTTGDTEHPASIQCLDHTHKIHAVYHKSIHPTSNKVHLYIKLIQIRKMYNKHVYVKYL